MFRFTIRDVLWLTVVVGLGVGWWVDHQQNRQDAEKLKSERKVWESRAQYLANIIKNELPPGNVTVVWSTDRVEGLELVRTGREKPLPIPKVFTQQPGSEPNP
jgi:hypothetical protein